MSLSFLSFNSQIGLHSFHFYIFWWYLWYQAVTAMFFFNGPFHQSVNQQSTLHCTVFALILPMLFGGTFYSTDIPMARKTSSRQPDISLLMLSSMSLPEIFWYSWNTEGRWHNCIISNAIHLNIRNYLLLWNSCHYVKMKLRSVKFWFYHIISAANLGKRNYIYDNNHHKYPLRIPRSRWFRFLTQSTVRNLTSSVPHRASPAS